MLDTLKRLCKRRSLKFILDKADPDSDEEWRIKLKVKEEEATKPAPLPPLIVGSTFSRRCTIRKAVHAHSIASVKSDYLNDGTYKLWCDRDGCKYAVHAKQDYGAIIWTLTRVHLDHLDKCVLSPWTDAAAHSSDNGQDEDAA